MVGLIEELQEKAKIMRRHEAHRRFRLLRLSNAEEKKMQTPRQRTNNYCNWSPSYKSIK